jgi:hypothetical protein
MNATNTQEGRALAALQNTEPEQQKHRNVSNTSLMLNSDAMDKLIRIADMMASARVTVPTHLQKNPGDCLAVAMQATIWGMNPFSVAQKTYQIGGRLGYEAQLVSAVINNSGAVKDRLNYEWFGPWEKIIGKFKKVESKTKKDDNGHFKTYIVPAWEVKDEEGLGVRVWATVKGENEPRVLELLMTQARTRNSTLWTEDPKQQIAYLASNRWSRLYTPDVTLGVYIPDELESIETPRDMGQAVVIQPEVNNELVAAARKAASEGKASFAKFWNATPKDQRPLLRDIRAELDQTAADFDKARTVETPAPKPDATNQSTGEVTVTFDQLIAKLDKATTEDALYVAFDWSSAMDDQSRIGEAEAHFNKRLAEIKGS